MRKSIFVLGLLAILVVSVFSGCQEQKATQTSNPTIGITEFKSDLVELIHSNVTEHTDKGKIVGIDVEYLFKNIAGRYISLNVSVQFYDKNNILLYIGGPKTVENLPIGYSEQDVTGADIISYSGAKVDEVDHVSIVVSEL